MSFTLSKQSQRSLGLFWKEKKNTVLYKPKKYGTFKIKNLFQEDLFLKDRICSSGSRFFLFEIKYILERYYYPGKQAEGHKSCLPLENSRKCIELVPYTYMQSTLDVLNTDISKVLTCFKEYSLNTFPVFIYISSCLSY